MKKKIFFTVTALILVLVAVGQRPSIELTLTAIDSATYVQLDSIKVMNRTQGGDTVLYWPDTVLSVNYVGIPEITNEKNTLKVFQNYPNPMADQTILSLYVPERDKVSIVVTDNMGRIIAKSERVLDNGKHSFRFTPGNSSLYFFTARWQGQGNSIKILQAEFNSVGMPTLEYIGSEVYLPQQLKTMYDIQDFSFSPGDELLYIGYADTLQSGTLDSPEESTTYTFQFATNIPCPGMPTVEYEGQVYNTIQIFSQCWLKENLNVGVMIDSMNAMQDNGIIEKYCYRNEIDSCNKYGGLYQWDEMMQYSNQHGAQGICPPGWHLPTDEEWKVLEGAVDSLFLIGDTIWNQFYFRGYDAGKKLMSPNNWYHYGDPGIGNNYSGFTAFGGGVRNTSGSFQYIGEYGQWWTSTYFDSTNTAFFHYM